jgi:hypothetical protein
VKKGKSEGVQKADARSPFVFGISDAKMVFRTDVE